MADRQDIDALLVGALYGELDSSERARLDAHLSSHPEDRASLDAMERTRAQVRRGIAELPESEPSPSISQLLMQAAKQGVPRPVAVAAEPREESDGLWARFVAWLLPVARHPGFAAMAALVLVAGTATAMWLRDAGKVSEPEMSAAGSSAPTDTGVRGSGSASASGSAVAAETATATPTRDFDKSGEKVAGYGSASGSGSYRVDLANEDRALQQEQVAQNPTAPPVHHAGRPATTASAAGKAAAHSDTAPGMVVQTQGLDAVDIKDVTSDDELEKGAVGNGTTTGAAAGGGAAAPAPSVAGAVEPKAADPKLDEWASNEHQRLIQLVNAGKCPDAGKLGAEIKDKAPEYYAANIANDRRVRQCKQYIEGQAKRKADKAYKSRSQSNTVDQPTEADQ